MVGKESGEMSWNMGSLRVAAPGESNEYLIIVYAKIPCVNHPPRWLITSLPVVVG